MISFLSGIGLKAWGYLATAATIVVAAMVALGKAKQAGRDEVTTAVNQSSGEAAARMAEAATQAPTDRQGVADDARKGRF